MRTGELALRDEFRDLLKARWSPEESKRFEDIEDWRSRFAISLEWEKWLGKDGWLSLDWPEEWGGKGLSHDAQAAIHEELALHRAPPLANISGWIAVGPLLLDFGTDEQRQRFLPGILAASEVWCQAFSEPEAGSDLYSLRTTLRHDGERYTLSGQKIWASYGPECDFAFVLCRDERAAGGRPGSDLTIALVDLKAPGVEVSPIRKLTGEDEFSLIYFDNVELHDYNIIGSPGMGRELVMRILGRERSILWRARYLTIINRARELACQEVPAELSSEARDIRVRADALELMVRATASDLDVGQRSSVVKRYGSHLDTSMARLANRVNGSLYRQMPDVGVTERHQREWIRTISTSVAAGTDEVQLETVAKLLGLGRGMSARGK